MKSVCINCDRCEKQRSNHLGQHWCRRLRIFVAPTDWCKDHFNRVNKGEKK